MGINKSVSRSCLCLRTCLLLLLGGELGGRRDLLFAAGSANVVLEQVKRKQGVSNVCCRRCCYPGQFRECLHQEGKKKRTMRMSVGLSCPGLLRARLSGSSNVAEGCGVSGRV